jgi:hypothetical protein
LGGGWWTGWGAARRRGAGARARARAGVWERGRGAGARVNQVSQMEEGGLVRARARAAVTSWPRPFWAERQGVARAPVQGAIDRARAPVGTTGDPRARLVCRDQVAARAVL